MKLAFWLPLALALSTGAAVHAAPINLVTNGSFEQGPLGIGSFQGWTTTLGDTSTFVDSSGTTGPKYGQASSGLWAAYFGSTQANGGATISQTLKTAAGQLYTLTFDLANDNAGASPSNSFSAYLGGLLAFSGTNLSNQGFVREQFSFIANGTTTSLAFSGFNDQSYVELDNIAVTAATPEPASWVLMLTGGLMLGFLVRPTHRAGSLSC